MAWYVNDEKIEDSAIQAEAEKLRPYYEQTFQPKTEEEKQQANEQLLTWSRENIIERILLNQAAEKTALPPEDVLEAAYADVLKQSGGKDAFFEKIGLPQDQEPRVKKDIAERMRYEKMLGEITADVTAATDKDIRKHYEKNIQRYTIPEMVEASHIIKSVEANADGAEARKEMDGIAEQLKSGAKFEDIASGMSDCPENAGQLGSFPRGKMVPEFENVVFALEPGQISDVFRTPFGYHIAKVTDRKTPVVCPLDDVKEVVEKELNQDKQQKALEKFVDAEKAKSTIEEKTIII